MALQSESQKIAHLLRRFGLGASLAELDFYAKGGLSGAIDQLLNPTHDDGFTLDVMSLADEQRRLNIRQIQAHLLLRLLVSRHPLRERMFLFWHDHFATSAEKVMSPPMMMRHVETLRRYALSPFQQTLDGVSKDPAMMFWLDTQLNVAGKPNENFAREIMELFTLSEGHYTEEDIREAARAFTGYAFRRVRDGGIVAPPEFVFIPNRHDAGTKTIFGQTGPFHGEDVVEMLCENPQTSRYIVKKIWERHVYANPEPALIDRFVEVFRESGLDVAVLLRAIMESDEFYSERAERAIVKSPIDFCVSMLRQMGFGDPIQQRLLAGPSQQEQRRALAPLGLLNRALTSMGMELLFPPDVDGWAWGSAWITSATVVERIKWAGTLFDPSPAQGTPSLRLGLDSLGIASDDPIALVDGMLADFDVEVPQPKYDNLLEAARRTEPGPRGAQRAQAVAQLLFGTPEFQFC